MAFYIELAEGESVTIGDAVVTIEEKKGRKRSRIKIDAPSTVKIVRGRNTEGAGVPQLANVRGDTHVGNINRSQ